MGYHLAKIKNTDWRETWTVRKKPQKYKHRMGKPV